MKSSFVILNIANTDKKGPADLASSINFTLEDYSLVFHPFKIIAGEFIHTKLGFSLDINSLVMGVYL